MMKIKALAYSCLDVLWQQSTQAFGMCKRHWFMLSDQRGTPSPVFAPPLSPRCNPIRLSMKKHSYHFPKRFIVSPFICLVALLDNAYCFVKSVYGALDIVHVITNMEMYFLSLYMKERLKSLFRPFSSSIFGSSSRSAQFRLLTLRVDNPFRRAGLDVL